MRVLLLGATGNLGSRLIPALLAHKHAVIVFVRSPEKLHSLVSSQLVNSVTVVKGDALDTEAIEAALRTHNCDALVNTAHNLTMPWREQIPGSIAASASSAAVTVGKERGGEPLRAWFIGGLGSIEYPGTGGWKIQDYMPLWTTRHHRETEAVLKAVVIEDLAWNLLCVAMMVPESKVIETLERPRGHELRVSVKAPPAWQDSWVRVLPIVGVYLNLVPVVASYTTKLEDAADLIAENLAQGHKAGMIGELVSMKDVGEKKLV